MKQRRAEKEKFEQFRRRHTRPSLSHCLLSLSPFRLLSAVSLDTQRQREDVQWCFNWQRERQRETDQEILRLVSEEVSAVLSENQDEREKETLLRPLYPISLSLSLSSFPVSVRVGRWGLSQSSETVSLSIAHLALLSGQRQVALSILQTSAESRSLDLSLPVTVKKERDDAVIVDSLWSLCLPILIETEKGQDHNEQSKEESSAWWTALSALRDRLELSTVYARGNSQSHVLFDLCTTSSESAETMLKVLMRLVGLRKNDVLEMLFTPLQRGKHHLLVFCNDYLC